MKLDSMGNSDFHILIIDDEEELAELLFETFKMEGFEVTSKLSAEEGFKVIEGDKKVDVIISDSHMEGMSGVELLEKVVNCSLDTPLFYLCTGFSEFSEAEIITKGAKGLLLKPYSLIDVYDRIVKDLKILTK